MVYETNGDIWHWVLYKEKGCAMRYLAVKISRSEAKSKLDKTKVKVWNVSAEDVKLENYLFICPPPQEEAYWTTNGCILLGESYRHKVFLNGIFVEEKNNRQGLLYGVNIQTQSFKLGRDRHYLNNKEAAGVIYAIWEEAISVEEGAVSKYLDLLLHHETALDVLDAEDLVGEGVARRLFDALTKQTPDNSFYFSPEDCADVTLIYLLADERISELSRIFFIRGTISSRRSCIPYYSSLVLSRLQKKHIELLLWVYNFHH